MVIDCHYHLEERLLTIDDLLREMDKCGIGKTALMGSIIEPFHEPPTFLINILQLLLESSKLRWLAKLFVSNFTSDGNIKILGKKYRLAKDPDNKVVFDAVKKYPDRFLGWIFVNPKGDKDPLSEFAKYKDLPGFIGIKAHPFWHHFNPIELAPVAEQLVRTGKPLLIHLGFGEEGNFDALLNKVPDLKIILAHAGFPGYADTWQKIKNRKNIYLDTSQTSYTSERATLGAMDCLGVDRLLFGTDGPSGFHGKQGYDYGFIKRRIEKLFPDHLVQAKLLGDNFAELTGIK